MSTLETRSKDSAQQIAHEAAQWWVTLQGEDCTPEDRREFAAWVARSPERVEACLRVASLTSTLGKLRWPQTSEDELRCEIRATENVVSEIGLGERPQPLRTRVRSAWRWRIAGVAAAAALVLSVALILMQGQGARYQTEVGEQRSVLLDDGSIVVLNTSSAIEIDLARERRLVRLVRGEALFRVAADPNRPFDVLAGGTRIRAVGTQFNVDRREAKTTVTVLEGKVVVDATVAADRPVAPRHHDTSAPPRDRIALTAGRQVIVEPDRTPQATVANLTATTAWTRRQLVFRHRPLGEVTEEFNRYNRTQIHIEASALREEKITGVFEANEPQSFVAFLHSMPGVIVETSERGDQYVRLEKNSVGDPGPN